MRVLIFGGRDLDENKCLNWLLKNIEIEDISLVISGLARGADTAGKKYAIKKGLTLLKFPADWDRYKDRAGPIRNMQMYVEGKPDLAISFPGGTGTQNMLGILKKGKVPTIKVKGNFANEEKESTTLKRFKTRK